MVNSWYEAGEKYYNLLVEELESLDSQPLENLRNLIKDEEIKIIFNKKGIENLDTGDFNE